MSLKPILPLRKGEALSSYLARVASFHGNQGVYQFLSFIELSRQDVMFPTESTIQRVANLTGLPTHHIRDAAILRTGSRLRSFRGETFHADFANFKQTSYCPACLLEDGSRRSGTGGKRVARVLWQIEAVRSRCCRKLMCRTPKGKRFACSTPVKWRTFRNDTSHLRSTAVWSGSSQESRKGDWMGMESYRLPPGRRSTVSTIEGISWLA